MSFKNAPVGALLRWYFRNRSVTCSSYNYFQTKLNSNLAFETLTDDFKEKVDNFMDKILYNTLIHGEHFNLKKEMSIKRAMIREEKLKLMEISSKEPIPVCLSLYDGFTDILSIDRESMKSDTEKVEIENPSEWSVDETSDKKNKFDEFSNDKEWMKNYEFYNSLGVEKDILSDPLYAGNTVSSVSCGGCGALLHCEDSADPGFLPSDIFIGRTKEELKTMVCQRCHFLKEYNMALNVSVTPEEYNNVLNHMKNQRASVILLVDLLDLPHSLWPGIVDIIGCKRPVFIVGNKVDLLPQDSKKYLSHINTCLKDIIMNTNVKTTNIKHTCLISAKTGYGIEELINKLFNIWKYKGDVYLVGCTNVGKSTLFNSLIQSDYCKSSATDVLQRATISQWPGTTLNLLKFPINCPVGWKLSLRAKRLTEENEVVRAEEKLKRSLIKSTNKARYAILSREIRKTFFNPENNVDFNVFDPFSLNMDSGFKNPQYDIGLNELHKSLIASKWCYDTPGVVHPEQITSFLNYEELSKTLSKTLIRPRTYTLCAGMSLLLAGIGRLDFLNGTASAKFTVFASRLLPVTVCKTEYVEEIYNEFLGSELLAVPSGDNDRLLKWPGLKKHKEVFSVIGKGWKESCVDIVLSSAGWVSITGNSNYNILAWTPNGLGIHLRTPPLLPFGVKLKGKKILGTPAYNIGYLYKDEKD